MVSWPSQELKVVSPVKKGLKVISSQKHLTQYVVTVRERTQIGISTVEKVTQSQPFIWRKNSKLYLQWRKTQSHIFTEKYDSMSLQLKKELKVVYLLLKRWLKVNLLFGERTPSRISI